MVNSTGTGIPHNRTVLVCQSADTPTDDLLTNASASVTDYGLSTPIGLRHFPILPVNRRRRLARRLVGPDRGYAIGGPMGLLDLHRLRTAAYAAATTQWQWWRHVTTDTKPAKPLRELLDRRDDDPDKYPEWKAVKDFHNQPRILAMTVHNALPGKPCELPTQDLEAFQAGQSTFANLAWLAAVPGDATITTTGGYSPDTDTLTSQIAYLKLVNDKLQAMSADDHLIAVTATA